MKKHAVYSVICILLACNMASVAFAATSEEMSHHDRNHGIPYPSIMRASYGKYTVDVLAGGQGQVYTDGPASEAGFGLPRCIAKGLDGFLYIMDGPNMRVYDGNTVTTVASLWDQSSILSKWGLDDEASIDSILTDQMIPRKDGIYLCGRMFLPEYYNTSFMTAWTYWDDLKLPKRETYGFIYSFIMRYRDGRFEIIDMEYSGMCIHSFGSYAFAPPDREQSTQIGEPQRDGTVRIAWYTQCGKPSIDIDENGNIYWYCYRAKDPIPDKAQREIDVKTAWDTMVEKGYPNAPKWLYGHCDHYICKISPDGTETVLTTWSLEVAGYERKYYPEDFCSYSLWLMPGENKIAFFDGAYYIYTLDLTNPSEGLVRFASTQTEERQIWVDYTEYAVPFRRLPRLPYKIGNDVYTVDGGGIIRLMDGWRIQTIIVWDNIFSSAITSPACFAADEDETTYYFYLFDLADLSLKQISVPKKMPGQSNVTFLIFDTYVEGTSPLAYKDGKWLIPANEILSELNMKATSVGSGSYMLTFINGRRGTRLDGYYFTGSESLYVDPDDLIKRINEVSVTKYKIQLDLASNRVILDVAY